MVKLHTTLKFSVGLVDLPFFIDLSNGLFQCPLDEVAGYFAGKIALPRPKNLQLRVSPIFALFLSVLAYYDSSVQMRHDSCSREADMNER